MLAIVGEGDTPDSVALERARRRVRNRASVLAGRVQRLMRLAEIASRGPDPEAALWYLEAARRSLAAFVKLTPQT